MKIVSYFNSALKHFQKGFRFSAWIAKNNLYFEQREISFEFLKEKSEYIDKYYIKVKFKIIIPNQALTCITSYTEMLSS